MGVLVSVRGGVALALALHIDRLTIMLKLS